MATPQIVDDDQGTVRAELPTRIVRSWEYKDRGTQKLAMIAAREFAEGWYQAEKTHGVSRRDLSQFEGM